MMEQGKAEKLRNKIISDAQSEARKIIEEGEAETKRIRDAAQAEADRITSQYQARAKSEAQEHIRRQVSLRELEARKAVLAEKGKIIEEVFEKALVELRKRDKEGGYALTKEMLLKAIEVGTEEIILSPEEAKAIGSGFIEGLNAELRKAGKKGEVKLSKETRNIRGGFILRRGRAEINSSFETLLAMLRDDVETEVAEILFAEGAKPKSTKAEGGKKA